ncbi:MAG: Phosphate transport system permease protein PstC [Chroococcidiopsis sp. SAG 2025]|uniref:phosphate ABC transporter permease subunit PstC n=1 Tax=Chroococcidiopsis sp. SAG 2025 TaxID=171389 RepID=UPI0029372D7B|nr:phosphate ABC transporter permease subunit PstC [Chroococcidiopsis sp. SAG 2025]MDV2997013.1 Phosphate transport system permease protein PstC [Chroococcidiopsis sp. SAG 2025]
MSRSRSEFILVWILRGMALLVAAIVLSIVLFLLWETVPILQTVGFNRFFNDPSWHPSSEEFNLLPMLWGTLFVTAGAVLIAAPLGILSAIFCQYYAPAAIASLYRRFIELLAGIPSVVYGFWGLVVLVPLIGRIQPPGASLLTGILILTLMILPTITLVAHSSLASVPPEYERGCAAMGLGRWATVRGVVLPATKAGLLTSVILGTGRAIGETMAVLMVCGNVVQIPLSVFEPVRTLTANIALEMAYATGNHRAALFVSGLVLMAMVVVLVIAAELLSRGQIYD